MAVLYSFTSSSLRMSFLIAVCSCSIASSCSRCLRIASSVAFKASSRRPIPISAVFHCERSCFFSKWIASISADASFSVFPAAPVSCCCASSCAS